MFTDVHRYPFCNEVRFTMHGTELPFKNEISTNVSNNIPGTSNWMETEHCLVKQVNCYTIGLGPPTYFPVQSVYVLMF